ASEHHLLDGRFGPGDLHDLWCAGKPPPDFRCEALRCNPERASDTGSARHHVAEEFLPLRPGSEKMPGARITIGNVGNISKLDRRLAPLQLIGAGKTFDEAAQTEAIEITGCILRATRRRLLDHIHVWTLDSLCRVTLLQSAVCANAVWRLKNAWR